VGGWLASPMKLVLGNSQYAAAHDAGLTIIALVLEDLKVRTRAIVHSTAQ
jgi:hypothetical protein